MPSLLIGGTRHPRAGSHRALPAQRMCVGWGGVLPRLATLHRQPTPPPPLLPVANSGSESTRGASSPPPPPPVGVGLRAPWDLQSPVCPARPPPPRLASPDAAPRPGQAPGDRPELGTTRPRLGSHFLGRDAEGRRGAAPRGSSGAPVRPEPGAAHFALEAAEPTRPSSRSARQQGTETRPPPWPARGPRGFPSTCAARSPAGLAV